MPPIRAYLQLIRIANLPSALCNVLAGYFVGTVTVPAILTEPRQLPALLGASALLYTGGMIMNDLHDAPRDRERRPARPLPSGRIGTKAATALCLAHCAGGVALAALAGRDALYTAAALLVLIHAYNLLTKDWPFVGNLNMAACRGLNVMLGISPFFYGIFHFSGPKNFLALLPPAVITLYVFGITALSQMEDKPGRRWLFAMEAIVTLALPWAALPWLPSPAVAAGCLLALAALAGPAVGAACRDFRPATVGRTVGKGLLAMPLLDAAMLFGFGAVAPGIAVCALMLTGWIAGRWFAAT